MPARSDFYDKRVITFDGLTSFANAETDSKAIRREIIAIFAVESYYWVGKAERGQLPVCFNVYCFLPVKSLVEIDIRPISMSVKQNPHTHIKINTKFSTVQEI